MRCGFVVRVPRDLLDEAKKATEKAAKAAMRKALNSVAQIVSLFVADAFLSTHLSILSKLLK